MSAAGATGNGGPPQARAISLRRSPIERRGIHTV